jgi:hypothetical protein
VGLIPVIGGVAGLWIYRAGQPRLAPVALAFVAIALNLGIFSWGTVRVGRHQKCRQLLAPLNSGGEPLAAIEIFEPSWVFYAGRQIRLFSRSDQSGVAAFLASNPDAKLILSEPDAERLVRAIGPTQEAASIPYFLKDGRLTLVSRAITR